MARDTSALYNSSTDSVSESLNSSKTDPASSPARSFSSKSSSRRYNRWSEAEEAILLAAVAKHGANNWQAMAEDAEFEFNGRHGPDLSQKYKHMLKRSSVSDSAYLSDDSSVASSPVSTRGFTVDFRGDSIFDIRTANAQVTEVFIGPDWSRARWMSAESIEPEGKRLELIADFERRIAAKQKLISRISPAKTPSRLMSSLALNTPTPASGRKRAINNRRISLNGSPLSAGSSIASDLESENVPSPSSNRMRFETPMKKSRLQGQLAASIKSSPVSQVLALHSDYSSGEEAELVQLDEEFEPERPIAASATPAKQTRCIIM